MADSVQWLSQSDYSICISLQVEFFKFSLVVVPAGAVNMCKLVIIQLDA